MLVFEKYDMTPREMNEHINSIEKYPANVRGIQCESFASWRWVGEALARAYRHLSSESFGPLVVCWVYR